MSNVYDVKNTIMQRLMLTVVGLFILQWPAVWSEDSTPEKDKTLLAAITASKLDPTLKGQLLIEELNCVACHVSSGSLASVSKQAPLLSNIGSRINPNYLQAFIQNPHVIKKGTPMPDVLSHVSSDEKQNIATAITHYLLSLKKPTFALTPPDSVAAKDGARLFHARGCAACHSARGDTSPELSTPNSTPLGKLDHKYSFTSLVNFLSNPHDARPAGRMPNMQLSRQETEQIAHYLLQNTRVPGALSYTLYTGLVWEGIGSEQVNAQRAGHVSDFALASLGLIRHHTAITYDGWIKISEPGTYTFYLEMNGGSLSIGDKIIFQIEPSDRRGVKTFTETTELTAGQHHLQLTYYHTGRKPTFVCDMSGPKMERQAIPSSMLSVSEQFIPPFKPWQLDGELVNQGKRYFSQFGCANCHVDVKEPGITAPTFATLHGAKGCLSTASGKWPHFNLQDEQREWITAALKQVEQPTLTDQQQLDKTLIKFNCVACHARDGLGGISPERNQYFTGTHGALGDQGRIPPPLTHVGAKLQPGWLADVLLHGKRQRGYVNTNMPQFGEKQVGHLVELFAKVDHLEKASIPAVENREIAQNAGHSMIGTQGFSCIACHDFNGQSSEAVGALDIVYVTERVQKNWFHLFMRQPNRFHPTIIMPSYWPGGQSIRPNILGGDTAQQIEAIWTYLEDGERVKKPTGLSRQSNELRVGVVAEICRGRSPIGYRGIAVGYPQQIHLAFDSEEMVLRELWKGEFANIDLGSFRVRGTDHIKFPPGIPFHHLSSLEDNWPYKGKTNFTFPHDQGYQFRGYSLDDKRRPTFRYYYGDIAVEDYFEDIIDEKGKAYFKRTMTFNAPAVQKSFYFRAATGEKVTSAKATSFQVDSMQVVITSQHTGIVRDGNPSEVLIALTVPQGQSSLTLEYRW